MIDERENIFDETKFGSLTARPYNISGNELDAFYDASGELVFVLDKTLNPNKPNVLLVINPVADKKWDEILSGQYGIDLENIRPKQDNKYQKLDIEYSGLGVYKNLTNAFVDGKPLEEYLVQLDILRDSAVRHSAMVRLETANEIIAKTNATIVTTKESIVRLQERLKTLRTRLSEQKKSIGRVSTKQSAAKILKLESMIEATNEKIKRAEKRLESAQKRLEIATVDAELATDLLNQPIREIKTDVKNQPLVAAPKYEIQTTESAKLPEIIDSEPNEEDSVLPQEPEEPVDDGGEQMDEDKDVSDNSEIKPLLDKDPEIINEDIAFKPISFDVSPLVVPADDVAEEKPGFDEKSDSDERDALDYNEILDAKAKIEPTVDGNTVLDEKVEFDSDFNLEQKPVLESMTPVPTSNENADMSESEDIIENDTFDAPMFNVEPEQKLDSDIEEKVVDTGENLENATEISEHTTDVERNMENSHPEVLVRPMPPAPVGGGNAPVKPVASYKPQTSSSKPSFVYYVLLLLLIALSVLTLWLYQKNMGTGDPSLFNNDVFVDEVSSEKQTPQKQIDNVSETDTGVFLDEKPAEIKTPSVQETNVQTVSVVQEPQELAEPTIINTVPASVSSFSGFQSDEPEVVQNTKDVIVNKPVYDAGSRYNEMFVYEEDQVPAEYVEEDDEYEPGVVYYEEVVDDGGVVYEYVDDENYVEEEPVVQEESAPQPQVETPQQPERIVYNGDDIYADDNYYEEGFDEEEAAYQAGYDGYYE